MFGHLQCQRYEKGRGGEGTNLIKGLQVKAYRLCGKLGSKLTHTVWLAESNPAEIRAAMTSWAVPNIITEPTDSSPYGMSYLNNTVNALLNIPKTSPLALAPSNCTILAGFSGACTIGVSLSTVSQLLLRPFTNSTPLKSRSIVCLQIFYSAITEEGGGRGPTVYSC